jgi:beta-lactamase class D
MTTPTVIILIILSSLRIFSQTEEKRDLKKYFDYYNHIGSFVLYDLRNDNYIRYNPERCKQRFIPASTFKIFNSLAAIETGAVNDENDTIRWDGVSRGWSEWNKDMDMAHAFRYSAVWFYQEIARRIGEEKMKELIKSNNYGNGDISGGIDLFWLEGGFRVSQDEQIEFLKSLYKNELKFSQRAMDIVKKIMIYEQDEEYILRAKTGWGIRFEIEIGWFVGYLEKGDNVYFFATNVESTNPEKDYVSRIEITKKILSELGFYRSQDKK